MNGISDMMIRQQNGINSFLTSVQEQFGKTEAEAIHIYNVFLGEKIVKIDPVMGQFEISHGAFWDRDVMDRALTLTPKTPRTKRAKSKRTK